MASLFSSSKDLREAVIAAARTIFLLVGIASTIIILASIALPCSADLLSFSLHRIRTLAFFSVSPSYLFIAVHLIIIVIWKLHPTEPNQEQMLQPLNIPDPLPDPPVSVPESPVSVPDPPVSVPDPPDSVPDQPDTGKMDLDESNDSMDATWKAIVERVAEEAERAAPPLMRKSDTWERSPAANPERKFRKLETFRRVSVGREELFGRAEAFIRTHYEQRRIQRLESEQRYFEMVNAAC